MHFLTKKSIATLYSLVCQKKSRVNWRIQNDIKAWTEQSPQKTVHPVPEFI